MRCWMKAPNQRRVVFEICYLAGATVVADWLCRVDVDINHFRQLACKLG